MSKPIQHRFFLIQILLALGVLVYVGLRAYFSSFTHDEALSYFLVLGEGNPSNTANHHPLNTFLMRGCSMLFGDSEFSLRLPNVLAFVLFSGFFMLIIKELKHRYLSFTLFAVVLLNPFLLDFFSLARGYGLSIGFMTMSLYYSFQFIKLEPSTVFKYGILIFLTGALSMFSNMALVNFYISIWLIVVGFLVLSVRRRELSLTKREKGYWIVLLGLSLFPLFFIAKRLLGLSNLGELYFGAESLYDSIGTFVACSFYGLKFNEWIYVSLRLFIISSFLLGLIFLFLQRKNKPHLFIILLLGFIVLGNEIEHFLFEAKFPMGRTTLYLFPIYVLYLYYLVAGLAEVINIKSKLLAFFILLPVMAITVYHASQTFTITKASSWSYDQGTKSAMLDLHEETKGENEPSTISNDWLFQPAMNYYIESRNINLEKADKEGIDSTSDYIYAKEFDFDTTQYRILATYPESETVLLKRTPTN